MVPRKIIHVDLDAFFCAVEELRHPELKGKPFAVGGPADGRGVISSCSYAARQYGVHSAMPTARALQLCPQLILMQGDHSRYSSASEQVMTILQDLTPLVEQVSVDEAFLDVSDLPQTGLEIARVLQARIRQDTGLPCSLGVATNKLVAKIATDTGKVERRGPDYPNAIKVIPPGEEIAFLSPLPVQALWGVGPKTALRLRGMGILTIGDISAKGEIELVRQFGKMGQDLYMHARGLDDRPVFTVQEVKSISQEITFDRDIHDRQVLQHTLQNMSEQVGYRLRQKDFCAQTVRLKLRWPNFTTITRQISLQEATDQDGVLYTAVLGLFDMVWQAGNDVRLIGVGVSGLKPRTHQLSLWETSDEKERRLLAALDALHERYGKNVVKRGRGLKRPPE